MENLWSNNFQLSGVVLSKPDFKMVKDKNGKDLEVAIFVITQPNTHPKTGKNYQKDFLVYTYNRRAIEEMKPMIYQFEVCCVGMIQITRKKGYARYMLNVEDLKITKVGARDKLVWQKNA